VLKPHPGFVRTPASSVAEGFFRPSPADSFPTRRVHSPQAPPVHPVSHLRLVPTVRSPAYDGPLDLLLFLVRRQGVDLREIPIAPIADAFVEQLEIIQSLDLDSAGEFVVMASTLCWLKSREILCGPSADDIDEEAQAVRADLSRKLFEIQRYRDAAKQLADAPRLDRDTFARPPEPVHGYERPVYAEDDAFGLLERFYAMLQSSAAPPPVHSVTLEPWTMEDAGAILIDALADGPRDLLDILGQLRHRHQRVFVVLAVLELARHGSLSLAQDEHLGSIRLGLLRDRSAVDLQHLEGVVA
jgi:segregation and condensation protein A